MVCRSYFPFLKTDHLFASDRENCRKYCLSVLSFAQQQKNITLKDIKLFFLLLRPTKMSTCSFCEVSTLLLVTQCFYRTIQLFGSLIWSIIFSTEPIQSVIFLILNMFFLINNKFSLFFCFYYLNSQSSTNGTNIFRKHICSIIWMNKPIR